jgi:hypothetical protein
MEHSGSSSCPGNFNDNNQTIPSTTFHAITYTMDQYNDKRYRTHVIFQLHAY